MNFDWHSALELLGYLLAAAAFVAFVVLVA
jgi:hypothetical protein